MKIFNEKGVRYLLIGGQAVRLHGLPRFSMDWDLFIPPNDEKNFALINSILGEQLDVPLEPMGKQGENFVQTYQTKWGVLQFHLGVPGLPDFAEAEKRAVKLKTEENVTVKCACREDLLKSKKSAGRAIDAEDVVFLERKLKNRNKEQ